MQCTACGNDNVATAQFCTRCGMRLAGMMVGSDKRTTEKSSQIEGEKIRPATKAIARAFEDAGIKHSVISLGDVSAVRTGFTGDSACGINLMFLSKDDDNDVFVRSESFAKVSRAKRQQCLEAVNRLNCQYRFARFSINEDDEIVVAYDFPMASIPESMAVEILVHFINIIDDSYPELMKAVYG